MQIKINKRALPVNIVLGILILYAFSAGSWASIIGYYWIPLLIFAMIFFIGAYIIRPYADIFTLNSLLLFAVVLLFNNHAIASGAVPLYEYLFTALIFFSISMCGKRYWFDSALKLIGIFSCFYGFMTILSFLSEGFYNRVIYPFITAHNVADYMNLSAYYSNGFTYHYSTNGIYLATAVCICFGLLFHKKSKVKREKTDLMKYLSQWQAILFILMLFALLLTNKRAHVLFTGAGIFVAYYAYNSDKPTQRIVKIIAVILGALIVGYILSILVPESMGFLNRFEEQAEEGDISSNRFIAWARAYKMMKGHYILGNGWGAFSVKYGNHVHNIYIQLVTETGIIGAAIFVCYFISSWWKAFSALLRSRKNIFKLTDYDERLLVINIAYQTFFLLYGATGTCLYETTTLLTYIVFTTISQYYYRLYKINKINRNTARIL